MFDAQLTNNQTDYTNFTEDQIRTINIISILFSSLSIMGSILIFIIYWFFKEIRSFNLELVLWYCFSNSIYLMTNFFPFDPLNESGFWCGFQSFIMTCFEIAGMLWTCIIGYSAFISVIKKNHIENNKCKYRTAFVLISFGISSILASIIIFTDTYGSSGGWCWIDLYKDDRPIVLKLVLFYFCIQWFFIILNIFFIYKVISILKANINPRNEYLITKYSVMKWYPIVQTICSLPATINRLYDVIVGENNFGLMISQAIFDTCQGCLITIVFINTPEIKHSLNILFNLLLIRKKKEITVNHVDDTIINPPSDCTYETSFLN